MLLIGQVNVFGVKVPNCDGRAGMASVVPAAAGQAIDMKALYKYDRSAVYG